MLYIAFDISFLNKYGKAIERVKSPNIKYFESGTAEPIMYLTKLAQLSKKKRQKFTIPFLMLKKKLKFVMQ